MVSIEHEENERQLIKKYTIEGPNQTIQTDADLLKYIGLRREEDLHRDTFERLPDDDVYFSSGEEHPH